MKETDVSIGETDDLGKVAKDAARMLMESLLAQDNTKSYMAVTVVYRAGPTDEGDMRIGLAGNIDFGGQITTLVNNATILHAAHDELMGSVVKLSSVEGMPRA